MKTIAGEKVGEYALPKFKIDSKATIIKIVRYWDKGRPKKESKNKLICTG